MPLNFAGEGGSLRSPEYLHALVHYQLVDRTDLFSLGNVISLGDAAGMGSDTANIASVDVNDAMTAPGEAAAVAVTALAVTAVQPAVARQAIRRQITDLMKLTGPSGSFNYDPAQIALDVVTAVILRRTALIATEFANWSNSVGTTTVDLTVSDIYSAMFQLQSTLNEPPFDCVLHQVQLNDFQTDLRGETGASAFSPATNAMLGAKPPGFVGTWNNIRFWTCDQVPTANAAADRNGAMFGPSAYGYLEASVAGMLSADGSRIAPITVPEGSHVFVEFARQSAEAMSQYTANYYVGVVEMEDDRGVAIITDA